LKPTHLDTTLGAALFELFPYFWMRFVAESMDDEVRVEMIQNGANMNTASKWSQYENCFKQSVISLIY